MHTTIYGLIFRITPSHGYLEVPTLLTKYVGFEPSQFSVRMSGYWHLEEDCDAPQLLKLLDAHGVRYEVNEYDADEDYEQMLDLWR